MKLFKVLTITAVITGLSINLFGENLTERPSRHLQTEELCLYKLSESINDSGEGINEQGEYRETPLRRFEIIFFISLPVTFLLSTGGTLIFKQASGHRGELNSREYGYILMSSVGLSLSIAIRDYISTARRAE